MDRLSRSRAPAAMDELEQIDLLVNSLEILCDGKRTDARRGEIKDAFEHVLTHSPQLFMQVAERIFEDSECRKYYYQYLFPMVPKSAHIPGVSKDEYKKWYMNICIAVIKNDLSMIDMVDSDILGDNDFIKLVVRKNIAWGNMEDWEGEYADHVVAFVKKVKAIKDMMNVRVTNRQGLQGITHGTVSVLPPGHVEDFLGIKPKKTTRGGSKRKRTKRRM